MNVSLQPVAGDARVLGINKAFGRQDSPAAAMSGDEAHLSTAASLANQAAALPDVREGKVQGIQAAIADGSYKVPAADVAQSLLNHMLGGKS